MALERERLFTLTPEQRKTIEALGPDIEAAEESLELLEDMGLGTATLKDMLGKAKRMRESMLKRFK